MSTPNDRRGRWRGPENGQVSRRTARIRDPRRVRLKECRGPELPKVHTGFRLAADVVEGVRATGKGYNARVERVLRKALAEGEL